MPIECSIFRFPWWQQNRLPTAFFPFSRFVCAVMLNDAYINMISTDPKFVVDDVLHKMIFLYLPESQTGIPEAHILKIIFCRGTDVPLPLDVIACRFADEEGIDQIINIVFDRFGQAVHPVSLRRKVQVCIFS